MLPKVADSASAVSLGNHLKNNRIEYIGVIIIAHLLGVPSIALGYIGGVC